MHPILAIRAFFAALFGRQLPQEVMPAALLPAPAEPVEPAKAPEPQEPVKETLSERPPKEQPDAWAVQTLAVLQSEGRLLDFLSESIDDYSDEDIGAAVREVHRGCKKALDEHFKLQAVRTEEEGALVTVPDGYDPAEVRLVGNVVGQPPFSGTLKHQGWRVGEVRLPKIPSGDGALVVTPAEVEI